MKLNLDVSHQLANSNNSIIITCRLLIMKGYLNSLKVKSGFTLSWTEWISELMLELLGFFRRFPEEETILIRMSAESPAAPASRSSNELFFFLSSAESAAVLPKHSPSLTLTSLVTVHGIASQLANVSAEYSL